MQSFRIQNICKVLGFNLTIRNLFLHSCGHDSCNFAEKMECNGM